MFCINDTFVLGALLLLSLVSADQSQCKDCIGDKLLRSIDTYDAHRQCWFTKNNQILLKEKIYSLEAIVESMSEALNVSNNLTQEKCKTVVQRKSCSMEDKTAMSDCLMTSLRTLGIAHRNQEQCHGEAFKTKELRVSGRLLKGNIVGWSNIHPDC